MRWMRAQRCYRFSIQTKTRNIPFLFWLKVSSSSILWYESHVLLSERRSEHYPLEIEFIIFLKCELLLGLHSFVSHRMDAAVYKHTSIKNAGLLHFVRREHLLQCALISSMWRCAIETGREEKWKSIKWKKAIKVRLTKKKKNLNQTAATYVSLTYIACPISMLCIKNGPFCGNS